LSQGFILSGEYQSLKSSQYFNQENFSIIGKQISSVTHGKTVDSYTIIDHFGNCFAIVSVALITGVKSGFLYLSIGVGTVTIKKLHFFKSSGFKEKFIFFKYLISSH